MQLLFVLEMCIMHFLFTMCTQYKKDIKRVLFKKLHSLSDLLFLIGEQGTDMIKATVSNIYIFITAKYTNRLKTSCIVQFLKHLCSQT